MTTTTGNIWEMLENPPKYAQHTADLFQWSLNFDHAERPFHLFLDLISWSVENYGDRLYNVGFGNLGYMELDYLADALKEYADKPNEVTTYVDRLMQAEQ